MFCQAGGAFSGAIDPSAVGVPLADTCSEEISGISPALVWSAASNLLCGAASAGRNWLQFWSRMAFIVLGLLPGLIMLVWTCSPDGWCLSSYAATDFLMGELLCSTVDDGADGLGAGALCCRALPCQLIHAVPKGCLSSNSNQRCPVLVAEVSEPHKNSSSLSLKPGSVVNGSVLLVIEPGTVGVTADLKEEACAIMDTMFMEGCESDPAGQMSPICAPLEVKHQVCSAVDSDESIPPIGHDSVQESSTMYSDYGASTSCAVSRAFAVAFQLESLPSAYALLLAMWNVFVSAVVEVFSLVVRDAMVHAVAG
ncbi:hypothetical protein Nepgr_027272 [Nepenthes gracilis]|uniref:Uncharacterized protein n=1 Tax=Nepenthes gracilis TaxID=150966 RepID=A0AAD3TAI3_NEPGR|nr:hypothetical protein Nepgr_027272 [Nepenthes gracilis]